MRANLNAGAVVYLDTNVVTLNAKLKLVLFMKVLQLEPNANSTAFRVKRLTGDLALKNQTVCVGFLIKTERVNLEPTASSNMKVAVKQILNKKGSVL